MARRQMDAYVRMGCRPTWTCAPYQAGHRPGVGEHVAWGESNAIAFANSVLGARTNRYGDFLDTCCALVGVAPESGLHLDAHRRATVIVQLERVNEGLRYRDVFFPVLGHWLGQEVGQEVAVLTGLDRPTEDQLKALGAAAASSGSVGLFHVAGVTPEAPTLEAILDEARPTRTVAVTPDMIRKARDELSTTRASGLDAVALGSPHFSVDECARLVELVHGEHLTVPVYVCTGRHTQEALRARGWDERLAAAGVQIVVDTCVVVTPVLRGRAGVLMTNSGKFAHYARPNTGFEAVYGSLEDCIASAIEGRVVRDESVWQ